MTIPERSAAEAAQRIADALDMVDLERLVAVHDELDCAYVRRWIVDMMGVDDERVRRWDGIVQRFGSRP